MFPPITWATRDMWIKGGKTSCGMLGRDVLKSLANAAADEGIGLCRRVATEPASLFDLPRKRFDPGDDPPLLGERREWDMNLTQALQSKHSISSR